MGAKVFNPGDGKGKQSNGNSKGGTSTAASVGKSPNQGSKGGNG